MAQPSTNRITNQDKRINLVASIPFAIIHLLVFGVLLTGVSAGTLLLALVLYFVRMFFITAGYHRYFSHRSYKMGRAAQFVMALGGTTAAQKGPLWWASHHRAHHRYADTDRDIHSPRDGAIWSHVGWILSDKFKETELSSIKDFSRFPELRFLDRFWWVGPTALGSAVFILWGARGLFVGFFLSTVLLWHGTFLVNSLSHVFGKRRYATADTSRNSMLVALLTNGEGWHNNHHYYPASARQGFLWWEIDVSYYVLRALSLLHVVHGLRAPSGEVVSNSRIKDGSFDFGMFKRHWERAAISVNSSVSAIAHASSDWVAGAKEAATHRGSASDERLEAARNTLKDLVDSVHLSANELARLNKRRDRGIEVFD